jgi:glycosyltransferase involved in cell wall biosynthesis
LSVVEAMHSRLPVVVSSRIGNLPEAVREPRNGWVVDPERPETIRAAFREVTQRSHADLRAMGQHSQRFAAEFWASRPAVERFLDAVMINP